MKSEKRELPLLAWLAVVISALGLGVVLPKGAATRPMAGSSSSRKPSKTTESTFSVAVVASGRLPAFLSSGIRSAAA